MDNDQLNRDMVDRDMVVSAIDRHGYNAGVGVRGRKSMHLSFYCDVGVGRELYCTDSVDVACSGQWYLIAVNERGGEIIEKWQMPRDEVCGDRADRFLVAVLQELSSYFSLTSAVSVCLGIGALESRSYCLDVLRQKKSKAAKSLSRQSPA